MTHFPLLLQGIFIGFIMCLPVGPISVLCIQRTLSEGPGVGFTSGLGAATADAIYCSIAEIGVSFVIGFISTNQLWFRAGGGILLFLLGINTFTADPDTRGRIKSKITRLPFAYVSTFLLTLANPITIISYSLIGANFGIGVVGRNYIDSIPVILGVFMGSVLWWAVLSTGVNLLKNNLTYRGIQNITRTAGLIVITLGIYVLSGQV
jgi:threonine/homoserine/homoserine lactone efflux protein